MPKAVVPSRRERREGDEDVIENYRRHNRPKKVNQRHQHKPCSAGPQRLDEESRTTRSTQPQEDTLYVRSPGHDDRLEEESSSLIERESLANEETQTNEREHNGGIVIGHHLGSLHAALDLTPNRLTSTASSYLGLAGLEYRRMGFMPFPYLNTERIGATAFELVAPNGSIWASVVNRAVTSPLQALHIPGIQPYAERASVAPILFSTALMSDLRTLSHPLLRSREEQAQFQTSIQSSPVPTAVNQYMTTSAVDQRDHRIDNCRERLANPSHDISHLTLASPDDRGMLNDHLIFLRKHIEFFQATEDDIMSHTRGRNRSIAPKQVGIRCRHCSHVPAGQKRKASTYFPSTLMGIYQSAQNINIEHLQSGICPEMPLTVQQILLTTRATKTAASGIGKAYWAESARKQGLFDAQDGIRVQETLTPAF